MKFAANKLVTLVLISFRFCETASASPLNLYPEHHTLFEDASTSSDPFFLTAQDIDQDGEPELIWTNWFNNRIDIYSLKERRLLDQKTVIGPFSFALGDVDGDGNEDLVVPYDNRITQENGIHLLKGNGDGTFQDCIPLKQDIGKGRRCAVADLNGDGHPDLIAPILNNTGFYLNDGNGNFGDATLLEAADTSPARAIVVRDFNKDGRADIAYITYPGSLKIHFQNESGAPSRFTPHVSISIKAGLIDVEAADLDGDGDEDIVTTAWWNNDSVIFWNNNGVFISTNALSLPVPDFAFYGTDLHLADLNGDEQIEIIRTAHRYYTTATNKQSSIEVFYRNPANNTWKSVKQAKDETICRSVATVDLDRNGLMDFIHTGWTHRKSIDTLAPTEPTGSVFYTYGIMGLPAVVNMENSSSGPVFRFSVRKPTLGLRKLRVYSSSNLKDWTRVAEYNTLQNRWLTAVSTVSQDDWVGNYQITAPATPPAEGQLFYQVREE
jgi:hypothetical protein